MTTDPTNAEIQELISFLEVFTREGFDPLVEWGGGELLPDGARTFPWPVYQEVVEEFFRLAGKACWCDYDYASQDVPVLIQQSGFIEQASLEQCKTILTYCVRGERFCDGFWGAVIREGLVQRLLRRLAEIDQDLT